MHALDRKGLQRLLNKIYSERGLDFREYKEPTLSRRFARRLSARNVQSYAEYARILDEDPNEYDRLFNDITINVTGFFRDAFVYRVLEEFFMADLNDKNCKKLRVWSAGCATGEEPYSIAILLMESLDREMGRWDIKIRGTDIDPNALEQAGKGIFFSNEMGDIQKTLLYKYFNHTKKGFLVNESVKDLLDFKLHNVASDPPYRDQDLVVCRNVLIYFTPPLQVRVLKGFHEALREKGFLLLGKAETLVGETKKLFHCVDAKAKLYRKK